MKKQEKLIPSRFYWNLYNLVSIIAAKNKAKYKINKDNDFYKRDKKRGTIVIYNHASNLDHFISGAFFKKTKTNYVVTRRFAYNKTLNFAFSLVKAIVRDQFKADLPSILKIKRVVERGGNVCIAPAGQVSVHGAITHIHPSIVKLIKMCKVDVYALQMHGTYLNYPKWSLNRHGYPIYVDCVKVLDADNLKQIPDEEVYQKIVDGLNVNDHLYQKEKMIPLKNKKLIQGFTSTYYVCPYCKTKYNLKEEKNNIIHCTNCNKNIVYNKYGILEGEDLEKDFDETAWFKLQENILVDEIKNKTINKNSKVKLFANSLDNKVVEEVGEGILHFDGENLYYDGTFRKETIHKDFDLKKIYQFPFKPNTRFNIPDEDHLLEFVPDKVNEVTEWGQIANAIYRIETENAEH